MANGHDLNLDPTAIYTTFACISALDHTPSYPSSPANGGPRRLDLHFRLFMFIFIQDEFFLDGRTGISDSNLPPALHCGFPRRTLQFRKGSSFFFFPIGLDFSRNNCAGKKLCHMRLMTQNRHCYSQNIYIPYGLTTICLYGLQ
jgi:hypothetical protein